MFYLVSSIRKSSSDSSISESSIEIQTRLAPRGLITKEPFISQVEVEGITTSNQMNLNQGIKVINQKDNNVSPEERNKWKILELPQVPKGNNTDIPVSVEELVYFRKATGVGTSSNYLDRHNELLSSSEEVHAPKKDRGSSEGLYTHGLQRTSPQDKSFVEKPKCFVKGPEVEVCPRKGQQPSGSS
ncbi:hypothetical protein O181_081178 [Austropuccinia psidii MF-1]|uniref:Uncharacterized protein n=1 Tax=Austropuccinia psidii MF-1 TaxID=1389203 RepID=A0A9Q3IH75_9BASI|nr:hypothetical protein [Austropuccinia psidii MF-1]